MLRNEEDSFGNGGVPNTTGTWRKYIIIWTEPCVARSLVKTSAVTDRTFLL
jgi:hypothetical protein